MGVEYQLKLRKTQGESLFSLSVKLLVVFVLFFGERVTILERNNYTLGWI
jgi:hypothetical protein